MFNFVTMGYDCSPAAALRELKLREFALPFDWIQSNVFSIQKCFENNFSQFHTNLRLSHNQRRLIDEYGFEFPHDYPLVNNKNSNNDQNYENVGEGDFEESKLNVIVDTWLNYYNMVKEKYNRRIERFQNIMKDTKPIIVLCRYNTRHVLKLQSLFSKYYKKNNIFFINSSKEIFSNAQIKNIDTEKKGVWNDTRIWKETIDQLLQQQPPQISQIRNTITRNMIISYTKNAKNKNVNRFTEIFQNVFKMV